MSAIAEFEEPLEGLVSFGYMGETCHCTIYSNHREEMRETPSERDVEGAVETRTVHLYDANTFRFTPGKLISEEMILANPDAFISVEGDADTLEQRLTDAVQQYVDYWAKQRGYDNCFTAVSYKKSNVMRFKVEATILSQLRDDCWKSMQLLKAKALRGDVEAMEALMRIPDGLPVPDFSDVPAITE